MISNQLLLRLYHFGTSILLGCLFVLTAFAKNIDDVVVLKNGDRLTGEIKGLQGGELRIKADYMAEAIRIDWTKVDNTCKFCQYVRARSPAIRFQCNRRQLSCAPHS